MPDPLLLTVPTENVNDEGVRLISWQVQNGQQVTKEQLLVEIETSKAVVELHAPTAGFVWYNHRPGEDLPVGAVICAITEKDEAPDWREVKTDAVSQSHVLSSVEPLPVCAGRLTPAATIPAESAGRNGRPAPSYLSPLAAQLAADLEIDLSTFSPPAHAERGPLISALPKRAAVHPESFQAPLRWEPLGKSKIAEVHLLAGGKAGSLSSSVMLMFPTASFRGDLLKRNLSVSPSAIFIAEVAELLTKYPALNSVYRDGSIGYYADINIGWAIGEGRDLLVTVISKASLKSLGEIDAELRRRLASYVAGRFSSDDLTGTTFTVSDMSGDGASLFIPLISARQSAILGVGADFLTLSFDHQVANGRIAAQFLRDLADRLLVHQLSSAADVNAEQKLYCAQCNRDTADLGGRNAVLLRCEWPKAGYICSLCLMGY